MRKCILIFILTLSSSWKAEVEAETGTSFQEFNASAEFYLGDSLRSSILGNASYIYHFNDVYWAGVDFSGGRTSVDMPNGFNVVSGQRLLTLDASVYFNLPILLGAKKALDAPGAWGADFYTAIGVGSIWIGPHREIFGFIGGGLLVPTPLKSLSARVDLKNLFYMLQNTRGEDFNSDISLSIGPSLVF